MSLDGKAAQLIRYARTDAGRAEVQQRRLPLSRTARNLLLIIDPGRPAADWLGLVQGAQPADLLALVDAGLVTQAGPAPEPPRPAAPPARPRMSLAEALQTKGYDTLYTRITAEARPRLGLIKGYKLILEVERCSGVEAMRALAKRFVEDVRAAQGDAAAMALAQVLLAPD